MSASMLAPARLTIRNTRAGSPLLWTRSHSSHSSSQTVLGRPFLGF